MPSGVAVVMIHALNVYLCMYCHAINSVFTVNLLNIAFIILLYFNNIVYMYCIQVDHF